MTTPSREKIPIVCPSCNETRMVAKYNTKVPEHTGLCQKCNGLMGNKARREQSASWKGGRIKFGDGYYRVLIEKDNPYYPMANNKGYVLEHRLVMAQHLKRCLDRWELVHHKNEVRNDNRLENLEVLPMLSNIAIAKIVKEAKKQLAYELFEEFICPMCYRLNPQHATIDDGQGCHYCHDREDWQALKSS